jgi:hypothetical protein
MGYIFPNCWLSKPNFVAIWVNQVGLLSPVQVPHEKQPQIQHELLKNSDFLVS